MSYVISIFPDYTQIRETCPTSDVSAVFFFVPRLFEEKWRDTVFGFPWCVARGAWCVVRGAWCVVRGSEFLVGTLSP